VHDFGIKLAHQENGSLAKDNNYWKKLDGKPTYSLAWTLTHVKREGVKDDVSGQTSEKDGRITLLPLMILSQRSNETGQSKGNYCRY
jgi:hypothetical protein